MILQFLVTVEMPGEPPAAPLGIIRDELAQFAGALVEFYGQVKPDSARCIMVQPLPHVLADANQPSARP